jgi:hypothetical protein
MAFATHLIALSWHMGRYAVVGQITADVDTTTIAKSGYFNDVSENAGYVDRAAILSKTDFAKYLLPGPGNIATAGWYASLPSETTFLIVHVAEWESGLD